MKTLNWLVAVIVTVLATTSAQATLVNVVNVDFQTPNPPSTTYSGQGAVAAPGNTWTGTSALSGTSLPDSLGGATSVGFMLSGVTGDGAIVGVNALIDDYFFDATAGDVDGHGFRLTINGLTANQSYRLALYGAQNNFGGRGTTWTVNGLTQVSDASDFGNGGFVEGSTYVLYTTPANVSGEVIVYGDAESGEGAWFINGFQINSIPEPSTIVLISLGGLLLVHRRAASAGGSGPRRRS